MSDSGGWAVITGASSGIGRALAKELAGGGFNLLLTGRNAEALEQVARDCRSAFHIEAETVTAELEDADSLGPLLQTLASGSRRYEVLVNNAGFSVHGDFAGTDIHQEVDLVQVQLTAALRLTKAVLPAMVQRHSGRILNVGSVYCYAPVPFQAVYSACKAFLLSFSAAIRSELDGTGVTVTVFCPGVTRTEFRARAGISEKNKAAGMTAEAAARIAYVQMMRGTPVVIPGTANRLFAVLGKLLPNSLFTRIVRFINRKRGQTHS